MKQIRFKFTVHNYVAIIITALIFCMSVFLYILIYNKAGSQIANTKDAFAQVADAQANESKYKELAKTLISTKADVDKLNKLIIPSGQIVHFIESVENVGDITHANVSISSISADDFSNAPASTTGMIHTHVQIIGSWQAAMRSLHLVETLPYVISTNNARLAVDAKKKWTVDFDMTVMAIK